MELPPRLDAQTSRRLAGHTFSQDVFDGLQGEDGLISKEDHLAHIVGDSSQLDDGASVAVSSRKDVALVFEDICYTVKDKKTGNDLVLLQDISATVPPGNVLAVIGPSGSGKSTLINVLTLSISGGVAKGTVRLGSSPMSEPLFERHCYVVTQQDFHWPFLTCREILTYAAQLYLNADEETQTETVNSIITKMGLDSCADTFAGNEFVKGLSGGQKRRLSIGLALVKEPMCLFFDEPTTGLDAAAAANIMQFITQLAREDNLMIVATIHQPSSKVYEGFDQAMILSKGREAFIGSGQDAVSYFGSIGYQMPAHTNPAEFFLDLVNNDFTPDEEVDGIINEFTEYKKKTRTTDTNRFMGDVPDDTVTGVNFFQQVSIMLNRHAYLTYKDPVPYIGRALIFLMSNAYFAIAYIKARTRDQDNVLNRFWLIVWFIGVSANLGVVAVFSYNAELNSVKKEVKNGMVSPLPYLIAKSTLEIPIMFVWAFFAVGIPGYAIFNFEGEGFASYILIWAVCMYVWEAIAEANSILKNPLLGMMNYTGIWFSAFLYAGFLLADDDMVWPFRLFYYILPLRYAVRSMSYAEFKDATFSGFGECVADGESICYGSSGGRVLETIHDNVFDVVENKNTFGEDLGILIVIGIFFKIIFCVHVMSMNRTTTKIEKHI